jgi:hypothetical protein
MMKTRSGGIGRRCLAIGSVCVVIALLGFSLLSNVGRGELADKPIYAALQGIELARRSEKLSAPMYIFDSSDVGGVFGLLTDDVQFPNAWIAASVTKSDGSIYMVIPRAAHIRATCSQVKAVMLEATGQKIAEPVRKYLFKNCSP